MISCAVAEGLWWHKALIIIIIIIIYLFRVIYSQKSREGRVGERYSTNFIFALQFFFHLTDSWTISPKEKLFTVTVDLGRQKKEKKKKIISLLPSTLIRRNVCPRGYRPAVRAIYFRFLPFSDKTWTSLDV